MKNLHVLLIAVCCVGTAHGLLISEILDVVKIGKDVVVALAKAWNLVDEHFDASEIPMPIINKRERALLNRINAINNKLDKLNVQMEGVGTQTIETILKYLPDRTSLELKRNDLLKYITSIDIYYLRMTNYVKDRFDIERLTLEDFAKSVVSHDPGSVNSVIEHIHTFIVPTGSGFADNGILGTLIKILAFPNDITYGIKPLENLWVWARAYGELRTISALYETFRRFQTQQITKGRLPSPMQAWVDLASTVLNDSKSSMPDASKRLYHIIDNDKLFPNALKEVEGEEMICNINESPQQILINLHNTIALTELKSYSMIQFSYMLLKLYNQGNFSKEADIMRERYEERTRKSLSAMRDVISQASRDLWKCDPKKHVKDVTYTEITELLQGYIQNEVDLNPEGTCRENCAEYTYTKSHSCYQNLYCRQQRRCNGKIINCQYIDSDAWVCPSAAGSNRRYEYVEYENGRILGRKQTCPRGTTKVDSWWRWLFWHCSYCMCLCDEQGANSDRYFNLRSSVSNITENKVITGLRFLKRNKIIHLQVQEGKLLPKAKIDPESLRWVPVEDYKITDRGIYNGQDFHTLTWEKRNFDLDDLIGQENEVVTGVRFKLIGSHLNFEMRANEFNFDSGMVHPGKFVWKDNPNTDATKVKPRKKLHLERRDVPIRSPGSSLPDSKSDQYIEFTHTDFDRDAAQTTIPFIDVQPVESLVPVPLSGVGVYHKGAQHFGGFIAPKLITFDYGTLLENAIDDSVPTEQ